MADGNIEIRPGTESDIPKVSAIVKNIWSIGTSYLIEQKYGRIVDAEQGAGYH